MHENDQATIKTRYCGHLYSPFLHKWTLLDQRDQVSYCKERGLSGAWRVTFCFGERPCRVLSPLLWGWFRDDGSDGLAKGWKRGSSLLASLVRPLHPEGVSLSGLVSKGGGSSHSSLLVGPVRDTVMREGRLKGGLSRCSSLASWVGLFYGWLGRLMSS